MGGNAMKKVTFGKKKLKQEEVFLVLDKGDEGVDRIIAGYSQPLDAKRRREERPDDHYIVRVLVQNSYMPEREDGVEQL
jgi:hypothetical protein